VTIPSPDRGVDLSRRNAALKAFTSASYPRPWTAIARNKTGMTVAAVA
jgi:hypothetical protein